MDMRGPGLRRKSLADVAERLRSVVRHLHRTGRIPTDLTPHIIGPMLYAYEDVPSTLERSQIAAVLARSEEHTSELQSLMRISYAVICLQKKRNSIHNSVPSRERV